MQSPNSTHILILEDDETLRCALSDLLEDEGYFVGAASQAEEALMLAENQAFDFMIFDIRMAGMDGLEAFQRLRQRGFQFPSLAMTGFAGDDDPIRALKLGVGDYLRKPFQPEELLESVARLLARHRSRQEMERSQQELRSLTRWAGRCLTGESPFLDRLDALAEASELMPARAAELLITGLVAERDPGALESKTVPEGAQPWSQWVDLARLSLTFPAGESLAERIQRKFPGRFEASLVASLDRMGPSASQDARGLLALAQGFLARGQLESARQALEKAAQVGQGQSAVEACLGLAELGLQQGAEVGAWVRRAVEMARGLGPIAAARATQWGALLLLKSQLPEAQAALRLALQQLQGLGLQAEAAVVELALGAQKPELVDLLLRPENEPQLAAEVDLLFPKFCQFASEISLRRLLLRYPWLGDHHPQLIPDRVQAQPSAPEQTLRFQTFGGFRVFWGGTLLDESLWRGPLVKYLLAFLIRSPKPVHETYLLEAFWPEGEERSRRRLSGALSAIRRALCQATGRAEDPIERSRDFLSLAKHWPVWHDLREFELAYQNNDATRMMMLYQGPYMEGCYMDWALAERQRIEEQLVAVLQKYATANLESHPELALEASQKALGLDPFQQQNQLCLMRAHLRLGQPEKAIREYERFAQLLQRELGMEPGLELLECFHRARLALP